MGIRERSERIYERSEYIISPAGADCQQTVDGGQTGTGWPTSKGWWLAAAAKRPSLTPEVAAAAKTFTNSAETGAGCGG